MTAHGCGFNRSMQQNKLTSEDFTLNRDMREFQMIENYIRIFMVAEGNSPKKRR